MKEQLLKEIKTFRENIDEKVTTTASSHIFVVNKQAQQIEIFHLVVAKLLYIMRREGPNLETEITFLCSRVSKSDVDDSEKINKVL